MKDLNAEISKLVAACCGESQKWHKMSFWFKKGSGNNIMLSDIQIQEFGKESTPSFEERLKRLEEKMK